MSRLRAFALPFFRAALRRAQKIRRATLVCAAADRHPARLASCEVADPFGAGGGWGDVSTRPGGPPSPLSGRLFLLLCGLRARRVRAPRGGGVAAEGPPATPGRVRWGAAECRGRDRSGADGPHAQEDGRTSGPRRRTKGCRRGTPGRTQVRQRARPRRRPLARGRVWMGRGRGGKGGRPGGGSRATTTRSTPLPLPVEAVLGLALNAPLVRVATTRRDGRGDRASRGTSPHVPPLRPRPAE